MTNLYDYPPLRQKLRSTMPNVLAIPSALLKAHSVAESEVGRALSLWESGLTPGAGRSRLLIRVAKLRDGSYRAEWRAPALGAAWWLSARSLDITAEEFVEYEQYRDEWNEGQRFGFPGSGKGSRLWSERSKR